jgi:hypothetical protein
MHDYITFNQQTSSEAEPDPQFYITHSGSALVRENGRQKPISLRQVSDGFDE